jgi:hypothetical protein
MPPNAPPAETIPDARPRRRLNQWPGAAMQGVKIRDEPTPPMTPKTKNNCQ